MQHSQTQRRLAVASEPVFNQSAVCERTKAGNGNKTRSYGVLVVEAFHHGSDFKKNSSHEIQERYTMKIGFVSMPLSGHLNPMTALARRLQSRGNEVVFFGVPDVEPFARAAGL